ncbi:MAG: hypothetical protein CBC82_10305 [Cellvibrionales bacterium TMED122]|nr:MAG: hypothetical protein CBC82_10305 [Cellvibrionales bacterium TMED122]
MNGISNFFLAKRKQVFSFVNNKIPKTFREIFYGLTLVLISFCILFTRSFAGIYLFGFRLGEILVGISFLLSFCILFFHYKDSSIFDRKYLIPSFKLLIIYFFVTSVISQTNLLTPYAFKTSSYIWTISFLFVGAYVIDKVDKKYLRLGILLLVVVYLFSSGNYPNFLIDLFYDISDKFQFIKGSEMAIAYITIILLSYNLFDNERLKFSLLIFFGSLFFPALVFNSRGAFLGGFIFLILELFYNRKFIYKNLIFSLLITVLCIPLFFLSSLRVYGNFDFVKLPENQPQEIVQTVGEVITKKETSRVFLSFYIIDGTLLSSDPTTHWRLDIWQDVVKDLRSKNLIMNGYGYNEIIPVMTDPTAPGRLGWDGLNENVHNYFVNVLARGGLPQLFIVLFFQYFLFSQYKKRHGDNRILSFVAPLMFIALVDAVMEGVNFPIVFYTFYGYFLKVGID